VETNAAFVRKEAFPFPLVSDERRRVGLAYGACDSPDARSARRISYVIGGDGRVQAAYPSVSPGSHAREVLAFLAESRA
jgi:peroxiredoxin Q/BCP